MRLKLIDMVDDAVQHARRVGDRKEVIEMDPAMARPGEMFGKALRLVAIHEPRKSPEMGDVERTISSDRQTDTVD